ncbi:MAG TPA: phosphonoacetate hydrolase [Candidatus Saccharimonadales bacterium]|nr:phosphonoacetate hydrolase [Candidatus Saccharimonadales bacterium]
MPTHSTQSMQVNGRQYSLPPAPVVVICMDGCSDAYLDCALLRGRMPHLQRIVLEGFRGQARAALPSFTNVNNASIITGVPPAMHGISGNFFYDEAIGQEVMMNSADYLRAQTIVAAASEAGRNVAVITAKEKLRDILSHRLWGIAFSAEKANLATRKTHGIENVESLVGHPAPAIYSADASLYVLRAGAALLQLGRADFLYLSLTDYIQHKWAPEEPAALDFMAAIDVELGKLLECGALIGATADHGMNSKQTPWGEPNVVYIETLLTNQFGPGFRVILPITDPYVVHHGALGSFAIVHVPATASKTAVRDYLSQMDEITEVYDRKTAARKLELPSDRIGDIVLMSRRDVTIGRTTEYHDLSVLNGKLRSHGGRYEEMVPFILSRPLNPEYALKAQADPRNFDIFEFVLNGIAVK